MSWPWGLFFQGFWYVQNDQMQRFLLTQSGVITILRKIKAEGLIRITKKILTNQLADANLYMQLDAANYLAAY